MVTYESKIASLSKSKSFALTLHSSFKCDTFMVCDDSQLFIIQFQRLISEARINNAKRFKLKLGLCRTFLALRLSFRTCCSLEGTCTSSAKLP